MIVREITESDLDEWVEMRSSLWPGDYHRSEIIRYFKGALDEPILVMVVLSSHARVQGHIELSVRSAPSGLTHGFIEGLYVKPESRVVTRCSLSSKRLSNGHRTKAMPPFLPTEALVSTKSPTTARRA